MKEETIIIKDSGGGVLDLAIENEKGYKKSIENSLLWCLHPDTKKLIPYNEFKASGPLLSIIKKERWYEAVLDIPAGKAAEDPSAVGSPPGTGTGDSGSTGSGAAGSGADVLDALAAVIRSRREEMPEGSYTTHLFSSGEEKIRKKTGEEAVELILARDTDEIVYESADLIYHLLVFLEAKGIPLSLVLQELAKRAK